MAFSFNGQASAHGDGAASFAMKFESRSINDVAISSQYHVSKDMPLVSDALEGSPFDADASTRQATTHLRSGYDKDEASRRMTEINEMVSELRRSNPGGYVGAAQLRQMAIKRIHDKDLARKLSCEEETNKIRRSKSADVFIRLANLVGSEQQGNADWGDNDASSCGGLRLLRKQSVDYRSSDEEMTARNQRDLHPRWGRGHSTSIRSSERLSLFASFVGADDGNASLGGGMEWGAHGPSSSFTANAFRRDSINPVTARVRGRSLGHRSPSSNRSRSRSADTLARLAGLVGLPSAQKEETEPELQKKQVIMRRGSNFVMEMPMFDSKALKVIEASEGGSRRDLEKKVIYDGKSVQEGSIEIAGSSALRGTKRQARPSKSFTRFAGMLSDGIAAERLGDNTASARERRLAQKTSEDARFPIRLQVQLAASRSKRTNDKYERQKKEMNLNPTFRIETENEVGISAYDHGGGRSTKISSEPKHVNGRELADHRVDRNQNEKSCGERSERSIRKGSFEPIPIHPRESRGLHENETETIRIQKGVVKRGGGVPTVSLGPVLVHLKGSINRRQHDSEYRNNSGGRRGGRTTEKSHNTALVLNSAIPNWLESEMESRSFSGDSDRSSKRGGAKTSSPTPQSSGIADNMQCRSAHRRSLKGQSGENNSKKPSESLPVYPYGIKSSQGRQAGSRRLSGGSDGSEEMEIVPKSPPSLGRHQETIAVSSDPNSECNRSPGDQDCSSTLKESFGLMMSDQSELAEEKDQEKGCMRPSSGHADYENDIVKRLIEECCVEDSYIDDSPGRQGQCPRDNSSSHDVNGMRCKPSVAKDKRMKSFEREEVANRISYNGASATDISNGGDELDMSACLSASTDSMINDFYKAYYPGMIPDDDSDGE